MTAEELIRHLKTLPSDTRILVEGYESGCDDIDELQQLKVFRYPRAQEWDGEYQTDHRFRSRDEVPFPAVMIRGRRGHLRQGSSLEPRNQKYALTDLVSQCDPTAPVPQEIQEWESTPAVGFEQLFMDSAGRHNFVDTREP